MTEWISVKDQEPPEKVKILVAGAQYGGTYTFISACEISHFVRKQDGKVFKYVDVPEVSGHDREVDFEYADITHWMPLPKHPA
jgi:hypothetical protein